MKRTHHCNELRPAHIGQTVTLSGWVHSRRDLGGVIFIDVRDREGRTQTVFDPSDLPQDLFDRAAALRSECVIRVTGKVRQRPEGTNNPKIPTGEVEVHGPGIGSAEPGRRAAVSSGRPRSRQQGERGIAAAISLSGFAPAGDGAQSSSAQQGRHRHAACSWTKQGFLEVETPMLFKSTPEGAREFLVPNRREPGTFYALAAVAAAVQANPDGRRRGTVLPTRPLFSRRRPARRPPAGIHADRRRDDLHRARGHLQRDRRPAEARLESRRWTWTFPRRSSASRSRKR